jgi:hypothetical protein
MDEEIIEEMYGEEEIIFGSNSFDDYILIEVFELGTIKKSNLCGFAFIRMFDFSYSDPTERKLV